jgi:hypothetical protein
MTSAASAPDETLRCARHPGTETVLRCGRCNTPICPRCLVATPVGARCPTCAQVKRFSLLVKPHELARSIGLGLVAAAVGTIIVSSIPFLGLLGLLLVGFLTGEAVSIGANRKRARELGPLAVACLLVGYWLALVLVSVTVQGRPLSAEVLLRPLLGLTNLYVLVGLGAGALLAWMRNR